MDMLFGLVKNLLLMLTKKKEKKNMKNTGKKVDFNLEAFLKILLLTKKQMILHHFF